MFSLKLIRKSLVSIKLKKKNKEHKTVQTCAMHETISAESNNKKNETCSSEAISAKMIIVLVIIRSGAAYVK